MSAPTIPRVPPSAVGTDRLPFDVAVKETVEAMAGRRGTRLEPLPTDASLADVIAKVNALIDQLQQ